MFGHLCLLEFNLAPTIRHYLPDSRDQPQFPESRQRGFYIPVSRIIVNIELRYKRSCDLVRSHFLCVQTPDHARRRVELVDQVCFGIKDQHFVLDLAHQEAIFAHDR